MTSLLHRLARGVLTGTGLQYFPVRSRGGYNSGARWTLYPWTSYWRGTHEPSVSQAIAAFGDLRGKTCWDLGAHYGYYACGFAQRVGATGHVLAVEPFPSSYRRLARHGAMNGFSWLTCMQAAASDRDGETELIADTHAGDTTVHLAYDEHERASPGVPVLRIRTIRLDGLVERGETRLPDFVKIDVEGHGHQALAGAAETLRRARPVIMMAFHSEREIAGTHALLDPLGYRWDPLRLGPGDRLEGADVVLRPA